MAWLWPLPYEINIDEATTTITTLLDDSVDKDAETFDSYETTKVKINV